MIEVDLQINSLPLRQRIGEQVEEQFALSTDDGANLADDDGGVMEVYNGSTT